MLIGTVAEVTGVSTQAIRFYERHGLLRRPDRRANGYRHYHDDTIDRLGFIRAAQASGLTLADIGSILTLRDADQSPCGEVNRLLANKEVRERQHQLGRLEAELERLLAGSTRMDPTDCTGEQICQILTRQPPLDARQEDPADRRRRATSASIKATRTA